MIPAIRVFVQNILLIVVLAAFLQLILPAGSMRRYAQLALSLVMVLTLLSPLLALTQASWDMNELLGQAKAEVAWAELQVGSELLKEQNNASLMLAYRKVLGEQLRDLVNSLEEIELVDYEIEIEENKQVNDFGRILGIKIICKEVSGAVSPVYQVAKVSIGTNSYSEPVASRPLSELAQAKVQDTILAVAKYFSLATEQVQVKIE